MTLKGVTLKSAKLQSLNVISHTSEVITYATLVLLRLRFTRFYYVCYVWLTQQHGKQSNNILAEGEAKSRRRKAGWGGAHEAANAMDDAGRWVYNGIYIYKYTNFNSDLEKPILSATPQLIVRVYQGLLFQDIIHESHWASPPTLGRWKKTKYLQPPKPFEWRIIKTNPLVKSDTFEIF